ncbi:hypothetical protein [Clostridium sp.]|uniref:hypothetical protein n=1 Tax=Clostridium sp. TaxID=1506 RepID=UPI002066B3C6|nr:hypothetical protein [Clostridium sp.]MDU1033995.1 hypothetical protein [Clostridium sp.]DAV02181.1 MAG TPA: hypothetical protein [Caudoviricetes sp.]
MKYSIENATKEDIEILAKYDATFEELISARNFLERIENEVFTSNNEMWNKVNLVLYAYKLGQMQGKREERTRRKTFIRR